MKLPRAMMYDILLEMDEDVEIIEDKVLDVSRWSIRYELIFKFEGEFYRTDYSIGATEYQIEEPWDGELEVECTQVVPVERLVTVYETVQ